MAEGIHFSLRPSPRLGRPFFRGSSVHPVWSTIEEIFRDGVERTGDTMDTTTTTIFTIVDRKHRKWCRNRLEVVLIYSGGATV